MNVRIQIGREVEVDDIRHVLEVNSTRNSELLRRFRFLALLFPILFGFVGIDGGGRGGGRCRGKFICSYDNVVKAYERKEGVYPFGPDIQFTSKQNLKRLMLNLAQPYPGIDSVSCCENSTNIKYVLNFRAGLVISIWRVFPLPSLNWLTM